MSSLPPATPTRRTVLAGAAATATVGLAATLPGSTPRASTARDRLPVAFIPHGGGPWPFVELGLDRAEVASLSTYLRDLAGLAGPSPSAVLVISAHWEEDVPTVMSGATPPLLYDYYGFPEAAYLLSWPAPGSPALAARVRALLADAGFASAEDPARGFDHGTFVPLKLTWPEARVPVVQLSLMKDLDPARHLALGRALAPLREEGVFIVGSGMSFHNLRALRDPRAGAVSEVFDAWLREAATAEPAERDRQLTAWLTAPAARAAHPREEHLLPLMVIAGAAGADPGRVGYDGTMMGWRLSAFHFG